MFPEYPHAPDTNHLQIRICPKASGIVDILVL
jgi:hypothetical protein